MEDLADKHGIVLKNPLPLKKNLAAGSDDHSS